MSQWYCIDLGDGIQARDPSERIQQAFFAAQISNGGNAEGVAVFSRYNLKKNIVTVYFSPKAAVLAKRFAATPCDTPSRGDGIGLLVGDASAWGLLRD